VRKRIAEACIEPHSVATREKLYELTPRLEAVLEQIDAQLTEAKLRKESAQARIAELKVAEAEGELISVSEVEDYLQKLFRALHQEVCIRFPRQISRSVVNAPDAAVAASILSTRLDSIFARVRDDHGSLMNGSRAVSAKKTTRTSKRKR
jgi:sugar-specific transcriptional regulator TrmB